MKRQRHWVKYKEIENKSIADIVDRLQSMARQAISENYTISSNKVTQAMVDHAQDIITRLLNVRDVKVFSDYLLNLFTVIPRKMDNVSLYLPQTKEDFNTIIAREQNLLDVMRGQVVQRQITNEDNDAQKEYDCTILEMLGIEFEDCDSDDIIKIKNAS